MGNYSGQDAKLQVGLQSDFSTIASPTFAIGFTNEGIKGLKNYITENTLLGLVTDGRMAPSGEKAEGPVGMLIKPDEIGILLAAALGAEASAALVGGTSSVYDHAFSPIVGGSASSLPKLTIKIDRKADIFAYVGMKVDSFSITAAVQDFLRAEFSFRGRHEIGGQTLQSLNYSTERALQFSDGDVKINGSSVAGVTSFKLQYKNNLEDNLFTLDSGLYMAEIEPQKREITGDLEVQYTEDSNDDIRSAIYRAGSTFELSAVFTSQEIAAGATPYQLSIVIPNAYITDAAGNVGGPDRLKMQVSFKAVQVGTSQPIIITLRNLKNGKYLT